MYAMSYFIGSNHCWSWWSTRINRTRCVLCIRNDPEDAWHTRI